MSAPPIKRPAAITPPAQRHAAPVELGVISGPCARGAHGRCTGRVYNAARIAGEPRFVPCDCAKRACPHGADTRARRRAAATR